MGFLFFPMWVWDPLGEPPELRYNGYCHRCVVFKGPLKYLVANTRLLPKCNFTSGQPKYFCALFFGAGPSPIQVAVYCFITSLQQTQEKLFVFIFIDKFSALRLQHVSRTFIFET